MAERAVSLKNGMVARNWSVCRCVSCHKSLSSEVCDCGVTYTFKNGVLDTLINPGIETVKEMKGMAREIGIPIESWEEIKVRQVDEVVTYEDLIKLTRDLPTSYYEQTWESFAQAFEIIKSRVKTKKIKIEKVLEVGSEAPFAFLKPFQEMGAECFAANLRYFLPQGWGELWPEKCVADMNELPFVNQAFDVVVMSATSHHSPDLNKTVAEIARVLKPGGVALVINDQISGLFKVIKDEGHRDNLIHENFFSIFKYDRTFKAHGLKPQYLFSSYYDKKLQRAHIHPQVRFATVARIVSKVWKWNWFRAFATKRLLWTAHVLFGFPLNVILLKEPSE